MGRYADVEPLITDPTRAQMAYAMIHMFETLGVWGVCARLQGYEVPNTIEGTQADSRPDITLWQPVGGGRVGTIVECVTPEMMAGKHFGDRWCLFNSACNQYGWELHVATLASERRIRDRFDAFGIIPAKVWCLS